MKVYISLPMSGHEDTVHARWQQACRQIETTGQMCNHKFEIYGPTNIDEFGPNGETAPHDRDWAYYMAQDIAPLLRCDAIYLTKGWKNSKGCRVEHAIAKEMGMEIHFAWDADESL